MQRYCLQKHDTHLWGRPEGSKVRPAIEEVLSAMADGDVLHLDLTGVEAMDFSFSDEVIGRLQSRVPSEYGNRRMVITGASKYVLENLDAALDKKGLAIIVVQETGWTIVGRCGDSDRETLDFLAGAGAATATQVGTQLGLAPTAANNRLKKLTNLGLLRRRRATSPTGPDQYVYEWLLEEA